MSETREDRVGGEETEHHGCPECRVRYEQSMRTEALHLAVSLLGEEERRPEVAQLLEDATTLYQWIMRGDQRESDIDMQRLLR